MGAECFRCVKRREVPLIKVSDTDPDRTTQSHQAGRVFGLALLDQTQAITQHLAGVLVTTAANELFHDRSLMMGQHNVTGRHFDLLSSYWQIMPMRPLTVNA
jgi:hypothetical protein